MKTSSGKDTVYHIRTIAGFLIIILGIASGLWFGWWLVYRGDIIEILRQLKLGLPGWGWRVLKYGLSIAFGMLYVSLFVLIGMIILRGGSTRRT